MASGPAMKTQDAQAALGDLEWPIVADGSFGRQTPTRYELSAGGIRAGATPTKPICAPL